MRPSRLLEVVFALSTMLLVLASSGVAQTVTAVHSFNGTNGQYPIYVVLTQGRDGKLYGTTNSGGTHALGTIFRQSGTGTNNVVLHSFGAPDGVEGTGPFGGLTLARDNHYYGANTSGGTFQYGVLYKVDAAGALTVLYTFTGGADGVGPTSPPIEATDGNFYGTTNGNVNRNYPTVYKLTPSGVLTTIYTFPTTNAQPVGSPLEGADGDLYVTAPLGGAENCGSITKMTTAGMVKAIYSFACTVPNTYGPMGSLIQATDGNFYGTTYGANSIDKGTVFKLDATGAVTFLYHFGATFTDGTRPSCRLIQGSDGNLYGTTYQGGINNVGTLFQITLAGTYTQLYSFSNPPQQLYAGLVQHTNGKFYGLTKQGGTLRDGTVYTLDMRLGPFVTFVRSQGHVGAVAQILGQGLTGATSVTFNRVAAMKFSLVSDTYMTAVVPAGATTGAVVVATPAGNLTSNVSFRVSK